MMYNKIYHLLLFRLIQAKRMLDSVGYLLFFVFLIIAFGLGMSLFSQLLSVNKWWSLAGITVLIGMIEYYRDDKLFLLTTFENKRWLSLHLITEYFFLFLPILIFQVLYQQYLVTVSLIALIVLMGYISSQVLPIMKNLYKKEVKIIPLDYFEVKFAVESNPTLYLLIWVLGLLTYFHIGFYLFWLFIIIVMSQQFFVANESKDMLHWQTRFVLIKIIKYITLFSIIIAFPTLLAFVLHTEHWALTIYGVLCLYVAVFLAIAMKYAGYHPLKAINQSSTISSVFTILIIIPGGAFITLMYAFVHYFKAEKNIKSLYAPHR